MKQFLKILLSFRVFRRLCVFPRLGYHALRYRWLEYTCRASIAWSSEIGVTSVKRDPELIVSLTTIPERIDTVALCLDCLLRQSLKPDRLILWLSGSSEAGRPMINQASLPENLLRLVPKGLEIRWCEDIRSFRKIIPTLHAYPGSLIVTADDDVFYPRNWLNALYKAYEAEPQYIHCHRAHRIQYDATGAALPYKDWKMMADGDQGPSLDLFPTGVGGVLYAPGHLHPDVLDKGAFLALCAKADDVWLKAMSLLVNVPCKKVAPTSYRPLEVRIPNNRTLCSENGTLNGNDQQIKAVAQRYGVFQIRSNA